MPAPKGKVIYVDKRKKVEKRKTNYTGKKGQKLAYK